MTINFSCCKDDSEDENKGSFFENLATKFLGLTIMDIRGYRRLRTIVQLFFETFPQILLQVRILFSNQADNLHIDIWELITLNAFKSKEIKVWTFWLRVHTLMHTHLNWCLG